MPKGSADTANTNASKNTTPMRVERGRFAGARGGRLWARLAFFPFLPDTARRFL